MVNLRGLSTLQSCGPHSLSAANYGPISSFSPLACAEQKAAAVGKEEVVSGELLRAHYAVFPFQILSFGPWPPSLCPCLGFNMPVPPSHAAHVGSVNEVIAGCRAAC
jgi:hypothetical protein